MVVLAIVSSFSHLLEAQMHLLQPLLWSCISCLVNQKAPGKRRSIGGNFQEILSKKDSKVKYEQQ